MSQINKILLIVFAVLVVVTGAEVLYYFYFSPTAKSKKVITPTNAISPTVSVSPAQKPSLSAEDIKLLHDPYYRHFLPLSYDSVKDKIYIDMKPSNFIGFRKDMGVDFASWVAITTYTKGQVVSFTTDEKIGGTISKLDVNKVTKNGKRQLYFILTAEDGSSSAFVLNETILQKTKLVKMVDGKETPMVKEELKNGDKIIMEGKSDLTKPPKDPNYIIEAKLIKL